MRVKVKSLILPVMAGLLIAGVALAYGGTAASTATPSAQAQSYNKAKLKKCEKAARKKDKKSKSKLAKALKKCKKLYGTHPMTGATTTGKTTTGPSTTTTGNATTATTGNATTATTGNGTTATTGNGTTATTGNGTTATTGNGTTATTGNGTTATTGNGTTATTGNGTTATTGNGTTATTGNGTTATTGNGTTATTGTTTGTTTGGTEECGGTTPQKKQECAEAAALPVNGNSATVANGKPEFEVNCSSCHGGAGDGNSGDHFVPYGPALPRSQSIRGVIEQLIEDSLGKNEMPEFDYLAFSEKEAIAQYVCVELVHKCTLG